MSRQESIKGLVSKETVVPFLLEKILLSNKMIEFHPNEKSQVPASLTPYDGDLILGNLSDIKCGVGQIVCKNCTMLTARLKGSKFCCRQEKKLMYFLNDEESTFSIKGQNN